MRLTDEERLKVEKLPTWARELIKRLEYMNEPLIEEAARRRKEASEANERANRLKDANCALMELLGMAGKSGLDWAKVVVETLEGYEIFRDSEKLTKLLDAEQDAIADAERQCGYSEK